MDVGRTPPALVLFGGLGSLSIFTSSTAAAIKECIEASSSTSILASRCHDALLSSLRSLSEEELHSSSLNQDDFVTLESFLYPPVRYDDHPIIELTTLCLYQLISFLSQKANDQHDFATSIETVQESLGFCAGLIPAAVVSCSNTVDEFLDYAVEAFKLSFWVGHRSMQYLDQEFNTCGKYCSRSLVTYNISQNEMEEVIESLRDSNSPDSTHESINDTQRSDRKVRIAAVSSNFISLSGPCSDLEALKEHISSVRTCRFTAVHALYHAGNQLSDVVSRIKGDVARSSFPNGRALKRRLRSTLDGEIFDGATDGSRNGLSEWIIQHMLIHRVHWNDVLHKAVSFYRPDVTGQQDTFIRIESFGPSTESLLTCVQQFPCSQYIDIKDLSSFGFDRSPQTQQHQNSIAIVGMAFDLPGGSSREELWDCLQNGKETTRALPSDRFTPETSGHKCASGEKQSFRGSFLSDIWAFDNQFFSISRREAVSMDPQQRLLLHCAQRALEDAGYAPDSTPSFQRKSIGCYIGLATGDYESRRDKKIDVYHSPGTLRAFHSGRIPYHYGFCGPCLTVDTACSSSAVAIYQACRALQNRECTAAIAGGINLICGSDMFEGLDTAHFLSKSGACKPFDLSADGYGRAEGSTIFVLKRYNDAIAENDRIHAVIKDAMINQSGRATSITHPNQGDQEDLIKALLTKANVPPTTISVVEAHGTGTQAGDVTEFSSIYNMFSRHHTRARPLWVSSIKGNIGHCEAASGGAGLVKLVLMLSNKVIVKQAAYQTPNPKIVDRLKTGTIRIPTSNTKWIANEKHPRRSLLHNFGAAGSNSALLVEEATTRIQPGKDRSKFTERSSYVFMLSATDPGGLSRVIDAYKIWLDDHPEAALRDICYTATARRQHYKHRVALACNRKEELISHLAKPPDQNLKLSDTKKKPIFVFSGQGAAYKGMGKELFSTSDLFQRTILQCDHILKSLECPSILAYVKGETLQDLATEDEEIISQCACVALEIGLARLLLSWGIRPSFVVGHSLGEFSALVIAGIVSVDQMMRFTALRAKAITQFCRSDASGMTSCTLASGDATQKIGSLSTVPDLSIACENGERYCVVSGPIQQLTIFEEAMKKEGVVTKRLDVPYAFHSAAMEPMMHKMDEISSSITWSRPQIPLISCVTGKLFSHDANSTKSYLSQHTRGPVLFETAIQSLAQDVATASSFCFEIGPHPILLPMIRASRQFGQDSLFSTLQRDKPDWTALDATISEISNRGLILNYRQVFDSSGGQLLDCPGYQFKPAQFENPTPAPLPHVMDPPAVIPRKLGPYLRHLTTAKAESNQCNFVVNLELLQSFIAGHDVGGSPICPASVFLELCYQASSSLLESSTNEIINVSNVDFLHAFVYAESSISTKNLFVTVDIDSSKRSADIKISSGHMESAERLLHFSGKAGLASRTKMNQTKKKSEAVFNRQQNYLQQIPVTKVNRFTKKTIYDFIFPRVVRYSPEYHTITHVNLSEILDEGVGQFQLPISEGKTNSEVAIIWYDTLFHVAGFMANAVVATNEICICVSIESIDIFSEEIDFKGLCNVHVNVMDLGDRVFVAEVVALNLAGEAIARFDGIKFKKLPITTLQRTLEAAPKETFQPTQNCTTQSKPQTILQIPEPSFDTRTSVSPPESVSDISASLSEIVCNVTGLPKTDLEPSTNLKRMGIDSMLEIELVAALRSHFKQDAIDPLILSSCETFEDLERALSVSPPSFQSESSTRIGDEQPGKDDESLQGGGLSLIQSNPGDKPPLVLFHDGSGTISAYTHLRSLGRDVYAFSNPRLYSGTPSFTSLTGMVNEYGKTLLRAGIDRVILGGWSFGGVLAFEMARFLSQTHIEVDGIILIDAPFPVDHEPLPADIIQHVVGDRASESTSMIKKEFSNNARLLEQYTPDNWSPCMNAAMLCCRDVIDTESICGQTYKWLCDDAKRQSDINSWQQLFNYNTKLIPIPGHHFDVFSEMRIGHTSKEIKRACEFLGNE